ncbi:hypothetical protein [Wolbachia endosymbiont of Ostrinia furnacalis]|uniref:hypothetical protein n=1 Tax=Wolbachia endosymbiont of Ostrinia furnacalis TaxID=154048 RepID=UPI0020213F6B|nr:hypothetical protein [Wolbachia endosymbiont of Ostrinia furnacalis]URG40466.1 hypothetical protein M1L25_000577 [Wolbachia endosymbiont of Ostrinia furnacalis]
MSTYIKEYVNDICGSQISKIHLLKEDKVRVFFKNDNGKTFDRTFSKRDIAEFLNQTIETEDFVITQDIENSIACNIKGIYKDSKGKYHYTEIISYTQVKLAYEEYTQKFKREDGIMFKLNRHISTAIGNMPTLSGWYKKILGFNPRNGLCNPLSNLIVSMKLESREDFLSFFNRLNNEITEQDIIDYLNGKEEKERQLHLILVLSECLPILCFYDAKKSKKFVFSDNILLNKQKFFFDPKTKKQASISQEQLEHALDNTKSEHYIMFSCRRSYYYKDEKLSKDGHAMLIYKGENSRYIFFDANIGVVGFCSKTGIAQLELNDVLDLINFAIWYYSASGYFREQVPHSCDTLILLRDVTLALQEVEEFYSRGNPRQQIVDISVDKPYASS